MRKESIAIRRDGLLGLGNAGWDDFPSQEDIDKIISESSLKFDVDIDRFSLIDDGYYDVRDLPIDMSWCKIEHGSIDLPIDKNSQSWNEINKKLYSQAKLECKNTITDLLSGTLSPIIIFEDHELVMGKEKIAMASALAIPVRVFVLKKDD